MAQVTGQARTYVVLVLFPCLLLLASCGKSTLPPIIQDHKALVRVAVVLGVGTFLQQQPDLAPLVWRFAHDSALAVQKELDVSQLGPSMMAVIEATTQLSMEKKMLLHLLTETVLAEVQGYIARAKLAPSQVQLFLAEVFQWIEHAALAKLGGPVPGA